MSEPCAKLQGANVMFAHPVGNLNRRHGPADVESLHDVAPMPSQEGFLFSRFYTFGKGGQPQAVRQIHNGPHNAVTSKF